MASPFGRAGARPTRAIPRTSLAHRARPGDQEPALAGRLLADRPRSVAVGLRFVLWLLGGSAPFQLLVSGWLLMLLVVGFLMTVPYGLSRLRGAEQYAPPRDAFVVIPQKLSTVLWVMIFWRSFLSVGDEVMTRVWNAGPPLAGGHAPPVRSIRSRPRSSTRSTTTPAGGRATVTATSESDDARLERGAGADRSSA